MSVFFPWPREHIDQKLNERVETGTADKKSTVSLKVYDEDDGDEDEDDE